PAVHPECGGRHPFSIRFLARAPRNQDPSGPNGSTQREWHGGREVFVEEETGEEDSLSRPARSSGARAGEETNVRIRRHVVFRARQPGTRKDFSRTRQALLSCRKPRRRRNTDLPSGYH